MPLRLESLRLRFKIFSACQATENCKENQLFHLYLLRSQKRLKPDVSAVSWHSGLTHPSTVTLKTKYSQPSSSQETAQGREDRAEKEMEDGHQPFAVQCCTFASARNQVQHRSLLHNWQQLGPALKAALHQPCPPGASILGKLSCPQLILQT